MQWKEVYFLIAQFSCKLILCLFIFFQIHEILHHAKFDKFGKLGLFTLFILNFGQSESEFGIVIFIVWSEPKMESYNFW